MREIYYLMMCVYQKRGNEKFIIIALLVGYFCLPSVSFIIVRGEYAPESHRAQASRCARGWKAISSAPGAFRSARPLRPELLLPPVEFIATLPINSPVSESARSIEDSSVLVAITFESKENDTLRTNRSHRVIVEEHTIVSTSQRPTRASPPPVARRRPFGEKQKE